jgi:hypothetical protein
VTEALAITGPYGLGEDGALRRGRAAAGRRDRLDGLALGLPGMDIGTAKPTPAGARRDPALGDRPGGAVGAVRAGRWARYAREKVAEIRAADACRCWWGDRLLPARPHAPHLRRAGAGPGGPRAGNPDDGADGRRRAPALAGAARPRGGGAAEPRRRAAAADAGARGGAPHGPLAHLVAAQLAPEAPPMEVLPVVLEVPRDLLYAGSTGA